MSGLPPGVIAYLVVSDDEDGRRYAVGFHDAITRDLSAAYRFQYPMEGVAWTPREHARQHARHLRETTGNKWRVVRLVRKKRCTVYGRPCAEHGFYHGAEAEELREGIENIVQDLPTCGDDLEGDEAQSALDDVRESLKRLVDTVDARDSLAYREATDGRKGARS
jgi:hypothetical protein